VSFAENLQRLREAAGLTQMDVCRRSGISIDSLRNWEQGRVLPRVDAVVKLASALGVSVNDMVKGMDAEALSAPKRTTKKKSKRKE
jgi:transcriptional regulator with XRE-family HTH domain